jgi:hypothetical protein
MSLGFIYHLFSCMKKKEAVSRSCFLLCIGEGEEKPKATSEIQKKNKLVASSRS